MKRLLRRLFRREPRDLRGELERLRKQGHKGLDQGGTDVTR